VIVCTAFAFLDSACSYSRRTYSPDQLDMKAQIRHNSYGALGLKT